MQNKAKKIVARTNKKKYKSFWLSIDYKYIPT